MQITRRNLLKFAGAGAGAIALGGIGINYLISEAYAKKLKISGAKEVISICPFCSVSCHFIAHVKGGAVVSTEGDPGYPVSEGALCAKGSTMLSMINSHHRVLNPLYRAPFSEKWEEKSYGWMVKQVARRIKDTRDKHFVATNADGQRVNRLDAMFHAGSSQMSNEEASIVVQAQRAMGIVNIDHQARI
jgi:formate dehydrogenase major subunit